MTIERVLTTMFKLNTAVLLILAIVAIAALAGCSGGDKAVPDGPVLWAIIPSVGGVDANNIYSNNWSGQPGKYHFALVSGVGTVVSKGGVSTTPTPPVRYGFLVDKVTGPNDAHPGTFISRLSPDSSGLYDLAAWSWWHVTVGEVGVLDFSTVTDCQLAIEGPPGRYPLNWT